MLKPILDPITCFGAAQACEFLQDLTRGMFVHEMPALLELTNMNGTPLPFMASVPWLKCHLVVEPTTQEVSGPWKTDLQPMGLWLADEGGLLLTRIGTAVQRSADRAARIRMAYAVVRREAKYGNLELLGEFVDDYTKAREAEGALRAQFLDIEMDVVQAQIEYAENGNVRVWRTRHGQDIKPSRLEVGR